MTKLTAAFRSFANTPKKITAHGCCSVTHIRLLTIVWSDSDYFISSIKPSKESFLPFSKTLDPKDTRPTVCQNVGNSLPLHTVSRTSNTLLLLIYKSLFVFVKVIFCFFLSLKSRNNRLLLQPTFSHSPRPSHALTFATTHIQPQRQAVSCSNLRYNPHSATAPGCLML